jgi:hypothetical protein
MKRLTISTVSAALPRLLCAVALACSSAACKDDTPEDDGAGTADDGGTGDGTADGDGTVDDTAGDESGTGGGEFDVIPAPGGLRRLTPTQYVNSVELIFGLDAAQLAAPPPLPSLGILDASSAVESSLTPVDIELYEQSANAIGTYVMNNPDVIAAYAPCATGAGDASCYQTVAEEVGRMAWRRPVIQQEVAALSNIATQAQAWAGGDFATGLRYEISALLQSPNFLYIAEIGTPTGDGDVRELDAYELATRLSFFLVGHTPDAQMLDLAEAGSLTTDAQVRALAEELLDRPQARARLAEFYDELFKLRDLDNKGKDDMLFPTFGPELASAMRQETQLLLANVVFIEDGNFLDIFDADYTFINDDLAALYNVAAPGAPWQNVPVPAGQGRSGFLTQAAFLSVFSHPDVNSPTRRGLFVTETLLCTEVPPPPPDVNPLPPTPMDGQTLRQWLEQNHNTDPACASCHSVMDPVGFALEHYNPIGQYRNIDNGLPIDASGDVAGLGAFSNATEMTALLRDDPRVPECVVRNLYRGTLGFEEGDDQEGGLLALDAVFAESGYNYKTLMVELTVNPLFRLVDAPK